MKTRKYGWKRQQPDHRDFRYRSLRRAVLPAKVDLRTAKNSRVPIEPNLDQGGLGSCGPNSAALLLAFNQFAAGPTAVLPARLLIYYFTRVLMGTTAQDSGVDNRTMLKALSKYGWCDEKLWPYTISKYRTKPTASAVTAAAKQKIVAYHAVEQTLDAMRLCLVDGNPFIFGFSVYESFESAAVEKTGDVPMPGTREAMLGGHDVLIVGYDDASRRFTFKNSWGEAWGAKGDGTIPYEYAADPDLAGDFWTIPGTPVPLPVATKSLDLPCLVTAADGRKFELREVTQ